jgi:2,4-dienoyl-CoA reductase-like NADH-dependent reductase (Old Yellow Enzyme family)/NADPH-dependent 2,4-dienoyl-CoA reductase/sulfur reductase-like enzyme
MPAMGTGMADLKGSPTDRMIGYYAERARGGCGLIIVEAAYCRPETVPCQPGNKPRYHVLLNTPENLSSLKSLAEAVKKEGAHIALQINHAGRSCLSQYAVSASDISYGLTGVKPRKLVREEIREIVREFAISSLRAREAGFDAVEVHGAHMYLLSQFLSPLTNKRDDEYGITLEGRARFSLEVVREIREAVGPEYPVIFRLNGSDQVDGGITPQDAAKIAVLLEEAGVDAIHVSGGCGDAPYWVVPPMALPRNCYVEAATFVKKEVRIPVICVGRMLDVKEVDENIAQGRMDFAAIGRGLIADPYFPQKAFDGQIEDIRPCIGCNQGCHLRLWRNEPTTCLANPRSGKETQYELKPAAEAKTVLIVGGGPAGLEAARVCALRGHNVALYEKEKVLGGRFKLATLPPHREEIQNLIDYYERKLKKLGVEIHLDSPLTPERAKHLRKDVMIVSMGSDPLRPNMAGIESKKVVFADDILLQNARGTGQFVVVVGGGLVGLETAEFLADRNKRVTLIEMMEDVGLKDIDVMTRTLLLRRLKEKEVKIRCNCELQKITPTGADVVEGRIGHSLEADTIVMAVGAKSKRDEADKYKIPGVDTYIIGDCKEVGNALDAIAEAYVTAINI